MIINRTVDIVYLLHGEYGDILSAVKFFSKIDIEVLKKDMQVNLICLVKGGVCTKDVKKELKNINVIFIPNTGRDIYSYYFYAINISKADYLFYFNTGSTILSPNFLVTCLKHMSMNSCNVYGATGSYGALVDSNYFKLLRPGLKSMGEKLSNLLKIFFSMLIEYFFSVLRVSFVPHIRTNAFVVRRDIFLLTFDNFILSSTPKSRLFSLLYESSNRGLSGQVIRKGGRLLVVGSDGVIYEHNDWLRSATYCSFDQHNLAVTDNRTKEYEHASSLAKHKLYIGAWGRTFATRHTDDKKLNY